MAKTTLQATMDRLLLLMRSGHPVIYIVSHEEWRVLDYLAKIFRVIKSERPQKHFLRWQDGLGLEEFTDLAAEPIVGQIDWLHMTGLPANGNPPQTRGERSRTAAATIEAIKLAAPANSPVLANSITVFFDIHQQLKENAAPSLVRPVRSAADALRRYYDLQQLMPGAHYKTIVIIAPSAAGLSLELERDLIVLDFPLPESNELHLTLDSLIEQQRLAYPDPLPLEELDELVGAAAREDKAELYKSRLKELIAGAGRGLTLEDYKRGLNMFAVHGEALCARRIEDLLDLKATAINNPALQYTPHVEIELGGLESIKAWINVRRQPAVSPEIRDLYHLPPPKGVLLCGVSGGGKSQLAKLIAKEFNLALLRLDVGALFGMYVGESEERTRRVLQLAEILAPVVLWLDEVDKAFQGMGGGGDNGVSARVFGHFLTWMAEKQDTVFVVATANDFRSLLDRFPEFGRKGRFDEIFWVGLPDEAARQKIFEIYLRRLVEKDYLLVTQQDVQRLYAAYAIADPLPSQDEFVQFCWILGQPTISGRMTGAEIEYAITEALYKAYEDDHPFETRQTFSPDLIVKIVQAAGQRVLYLSGSPADIELGLMEGIVAANHWTSAG
jgi:hypothetical protein